MHPAQDRVDRLPPVNWFTYCSVLITPEWAQLSKITMPDRVSKKTAWSSTSGSGREHAASRKKGPPVSSKSVTRGTGPVTMRSPSTGVGDVVATHDPLRWRIARSQGCGMPISREVPSWLRANLGSNAAGCAKM